MRFIDLSQAPDLPASWIALEAVRQTALSKLEKSKRREYVQNNNGWSQLKQWLSALSSEKCWYCEAKALRSVLDVDHFRPKLRVTVDGVTIAAHSGYWWLAYEWKNYRLACQRCNRPFTNASGAPTGKRNEFPIRDEAARAADPDGSIDNEDPRLLDPCVESDPALLEHCWDGEVRPRADEPTWDWQRAQYTIKQLGLGDPQVTEEKRKRWQSLAVLLQLVDDQGVVVTPQIVELFRQALDPATEYSVFLRSAIETHRDKEWIEALL